MQSPVTRGRPATPCLDALSRQIAAMAAPCVGCPGCRGLCDALIEALTLPDAVLRRAPA